MDQPGKLGSGVPTSRVRVRVQAKGLGSRLYSRVGEVETQYMRNCQSDSSQKIYGIISYYQYSILLAYSPAVPIMCIMACLHKNKKFSLSCPRPFSSVPQNCPGTGYTGYHLSTWTPLKMPSWANGSTSDRTGPEVLCCTILSYYIFQLSTYMWCCMHTKPVSVYLLSC